MVGLKTKPTKSISDWRRTKILATIGPATDSQELIYNLLAAGVNGIRLNFSHGTYEERERQIKWARDAALNLGRELAIVQDLQGPKIRLGDFEGVVDVKKGQTLLLEHNADFAQTGHLPIQYDLSIKVKRGERILLFDGRIHTIVTAIKDGIIYAEALNDGMLIKRKGINVPDTDFGGDVITAKDRSDLVWGSNQDFDYVALSFVQSAEDIQKLRQLMSSMNYQAKIIAKIETRSAIENIEEIVKEADVVMVARGDLAVETPAESIPIVQRKIIGLGLRYGTPSIVATQMLISMTAELEPSRAEVSDVATAVLVGADCLMLSDETASGNYPVEAVKMMQRIIRYTEVHSPLSVSFNNEADHSVGAAIADAIIKLASTIKARAIVAETKSGATAFNIAARRAKTPLIAVTDLKRTAHQLALVFGVESYIRPADKTAATKLTDFLHNHKVFDRGDIIVTVSGKYPGVVGTTDTIKVRIID
jgi:pyruvate kinase